MALQRVMTNLSLKFDNLASQISKLLELFEISAKTLAEKTHDLKDNKNSGEIVKILDNLLEQNKVVVGKLIFLAVISNIIGSKFIIRKMVYNPGLK